MSVACAVILAGGMSARMGRDKAMLPVAGVPMIHRVARVGLAACGRVLVVGRGRMADWPENLPSEFLEDEADVGGRGPISGLLTALEHVKAPVLLLSCDMPLLSEKAARQLMAAHRAGALATMAVTADENGAEQVEPAMAIYSPEVLPVLREMVRNGRRGLHRLREVEGVSLWRVPADAHWELFNVNDDVALAEANRRAVK